MEKIYGFVQFSISDGSLDAFIKAAAACHEAILPDITGTQYYEWFINADGTRGYVIEVFDDLAAVALHGRMLAGRMEEVMQHATLRIDIGGNAPEPIQERMWQKLGAFSYIGPRIHGLMQQPTPHREPPAADARIYALASFRPYPGKEAILADLARRSFEVARSLDPGTLGMNCSAAQMAAGSRWMSTATPMQCWRT